MKKDIDFKEIYFHIADFDSNESFEYTLEQLGLTRDIDNDIQSITLTVTQVETFNR